MCVCVRPRGTRKEEREKKREEGERKRTLCEPQQQEPLKISALVGWVGGWKKGR